MLRLPPPMDRLSIFAPAFTHPTFGRFVLLTLAGIVTLGRHTLSRMLLRVRGLMAGHFSSYHRFFSCAVWSMPVLGRLLATMVLELIPENQRVLLAIDDTVDQHRGKKVWGKGCHRDAVRSSQAELVKKWGHKWVVLAVLFKFPFTSRAWALPVLCALYRPRQDSQKANRRHKTPPELARGLLAMMLHWFPQRQFTALGDWGFGTHELARFARHHRRRLTLVARMRRDTNLFALTKNRWNSARCRKGGKLPSPAATVKKARLCSATLHWYGNSLREVELFSACGGWYRPTWRGVGALVPMRWVFVRDTVGGREDWFYSTDPTLEPWQIVELFAGRWSIEATFEEVRAHLGLETTRSRVRESVLRTAPCLFGLFTLVSLLWADLLKVTGKHPRLQDTPCYHKTQPTFADALFAVRRWVWAKIILQHRPWEGLVTTCPPRLRQTLLDCLCAPA
jgi:hypothetical protein